MFKELKFDYSCTFLSQFATFTGGWVAVRPAQVTDKADSKVGFLHFQAIIAKKLEVGEGLS